MIIFLSAPEGADIAEEPCSKDVYKRLAKVPRVW